jgi:hypothetical protein
MSIERFSDFDCMERIIEEAVVLLNEIWEKVLARLRLAARASKQDQDVIRGGCSY